MVLYAQDRSAFETDTIKTSKSDLKITFIKHATLVFEFNHLVIHVDPVGRYADYSKMPKADIILITHQHGDHFDSDAINKIRQKGTDIICTKLVADKLDKTIVLNNGDETTVKGIPVKAVPAYNIVHRRKNGELFHPKGMGNGYVLKFGDKKVYIAGDTENISEMKLLNGQINIAFLPMNLPYTMSPEMVADAVKLFNPKILYPYHYGKTDVNQIIELLKIKKDCEIRIRQMQ